MQVLVYPGLHLDRYDVLPHVFIGQVGERAHGQDGLERADVTGTGQAVVHVGVEPLQVVLLDLQGRPVILTVPLGLLEQAVQYLMIPRALGGLLGILVVVGQGRDGPAERLLLTEARVIRVVKYLYYTVPYHDALFILVR